MTAHTTATGCADDAPTGPTLRRVGRPTGRGMAAVVAVAALVLGTGCSGDDGTDPDTTIGTTAPAPATTTTEAPLDAGERIYVYDPAVGDCFDRRVLTEEEGGDEIVLLLDCDLPHEVEVFHVTTIDETTLPTTTTTALPPTTAPSTTTAPPATGVGGATTSSTLDLDDAIGADHGAEEPAADDWPGEDALERLAKRQCAAAFAPWAGIAYELSELEMGWMVPDEEGWSSGERTLACTVYDPSGTAETPSRLAGSMAGAGR